MSDKYVYLFIRKDLSVQQQIIQTAHVNHQMAVNLEDREMPNAVLIGADDLLHLQDISDHLSVYGVEHEVFFEPDINEITAIATYPLAGDSRKPLRIFRTM